MDSTAEERSDKLEDRTAQMSQPEAQKEEKQTGKKKIRGHRKYLWENIKYYNSHKIEISNNRS